MKRRSFFAAIAGLFCLPWKPARKFFDVPEGYDVMRIPLHGSRMSIDARRELALSKRIMEETKPRVVHGALNLSKLKRPYRWQVRYEGFDCYFVVCEGEYTRRPGNG